MGEAIIIKSAAEIEHLRKAGRIASEARTIAREAIRAGETTYAVDREIRRFIQSKGARPTFLGYDDFPASACISVNEEIIHGIPGPRKLQNGDIVSVDVGATFEGFVGDCAGTFPVGNISAEAKKLIDVTRQSFFEGIKFARAGYRISDIGHAVQQYVESFGFSVVRDYVGHGVGREMHEAPEVPNYGKPGHGPRLQPGMVIAVEPMVCAGNYEDEVMDNGWTVITVDHSLAAHYENTIAITDGDPEILTMSDGFDA
jgi:methionyl aminopeptidase